MRLNSLYALKYIWGIVLFQIIRFSVRFSLSETNSILNTIVEHKSSNIFTKTKETNLKTKFASIDQFYIEFMHFIPFTDKIVVSYYLVLKTLAMNKNDKTIEHI